MVQSYQSPAHHSICFLQRVCVIPECVANRYEYLCDMAMEWIFPLAEIDAVAGAFAAWCGSRHVFALEGDMGAGKTTLVHAICRAMGVEDAMSSPTYSLVNRYKAPGLGEILHMDLYRLSDMEEALDAGIGEDLDSGSVCFVEWPSRAAELFPDGVTDLYLDVLEDGRRRLRVRDRT
jgi:tRNA threonylcarbamoyladenosine biosynthesis protein TsaE